jgi:hypothetical protein
MNIDQVLSLIRRKIDAFDTQREAAETWGVSEAYLSEVLKGRQKPGKKILDALDLEHIDKYRYRKRE